jgi:hypothetical protein
VTVEWLETQRVLHNFFIRRADDETLPRRLDVAAPNGLSGPARRRVVDATGGDLVRQVRDRVGDSLCSTDDDGSHWPSRMGSRWPSLDTEAAA